MRRWIYVVTVCCLTALVNGQNVAFKKLDLMDSLQGSRGVSIGDLDGNGLLDIVVSNYVDSTRLLGNTIYMNTKEGFTQRFISENKVDAWSESVHTVDVDNDGDLDLFFTTQFGVPNLLYQNNGTGGFTAWEAGDLTSDHTNSPGACWCDYDLDGDMDVFVVNRDGEPDNLYVNNGKGTFKRKKEGPWILNKGDGRSCVWGDLNGDGHLDLYVTNFVVKDQNGKVTGKHRNYAYFGTGDGGFNEIDEGAFVQDKNASYGASFTDFDYDGDLDIYVTNVASSDENAFYENLGEGIFGIVQNDASYEVRRPSKGQTWGDFNNDSRLDLYVANGTEGYPEIQNFLFLGQEDASMKRVYNALPAVEAHISAGTASGDLDRDGDLDIYVCNWGTDSMANDLYLNTSASKNWIVFQLAGTKSNALGLGSWITLTMEDGSVQTRFFSRDTGYGSENAPEVHFGLGESQIQKVEIQWPSEIKQTAQDLEVNHYYKAIEGESIKKSAL